MRGRQPISTAPRARAFRRAAALVLVPLAAGGCLFGGGGSKEQMVTIRVDNNLVPASPLTISLIPATGDRRAVGTVPASTSRELRIPVGSSTDPHRLLAEAASGPGYTSRTFTLSSAATVEWNVGQNALNVIPR